jgi:phage gpG-like protein
MYRMTVDITPDSRIIGASFGAIAKGFRGFSRPLEASVREVAIPAIQENFEVGGRPPWTPHSEATEVRRAREGTLGGEPQDILIETGLLFGDATRLARWTINRDEAYISNLPNRSAYGRFHQTGTEFMPQRPWATLDSNDADNIEDVFEQWRDGIIARSLWSRVIRRLF